MLPFLGKSGVAHTPEVLKLHGRRNFLRNTVLRQLASNVDEPKVTRSDAVKFHSVQHFSVEKTPITAQLWLQRMAGRDSMVASSSSAQTANSYMVKESVKTEELAPTFLLDKTSKESRLTIRYNFSQDGTYFPSCTEEKRWLIIVQ